MFLINSTAGACASCHDNVMNYKSLLKTQLISLVIYRNRNLGSPAVPQLQNLF